VLAQARERCLDLRAVAAREQIDGLVGSVGQGRSSLDA
jgi:hypothetical protein